jgi:hypothetical protein
MKYKIKQYQTSVNLDLSQLSIEQIKIRALAIEETGEKKVCKFCSKNKLLSDYRLRTIRRGVKGIYYDATCKDCHARTRGTKTIGKLSFAKDLFKKGFRRCTTCKQIKPLTEYYKNKASHSGISNSCKNCQNDINCKKYHASKP